MPVIGSKEAKHAPADVRHLSHLQKTNLGSFYTPPHIVRLVYDLLRKNTPKNFADTILEPACGYGAFLSEATSLPGIRFIGADMDADAIATARRKHPDIPFYTHNALAQISRSKYGIRANERLVIIGNPPYNDVTSHAKKRIKSAPCKIDPEVRTRDLGLSFLLSAAKLEPDYIAILHPLSYLIKETNFKVLRPLMDNYRLRDAIVFNSQEFTETSKGCGFPIVAAIYEKHAQGTTHEQIRQRKFRTLEKVMFSVSDYDYISRYITKYPSRPAPLEKNDKKIRFFTMRDINALKRSRTFIQEDTANTININPEKLPYYCYIDALKDIVRSLPYHLGNFDLMIDHAAFRSIKNDFLSLSIAKHPAIFSPRFPMPSAAKICAAKQHIQEYFQTLFKTKNLCV